MEFRIYVKKSFQDMTPQSLFNRYRFLLILFFVFISIQSCTLRKMTRIGAREQQITVTPAILEVSGQEVNFEVTAQIPPELLKPDYTYALQYYYKYQNELEPVGRMVFKSGEYVYVKGKPTITKQFSFMYAPKKAVGTLVVQGEATSKKGSLGYAPLQHLASGLITTSRFIVRENQSSFAPENYVPEGDEPTIITFYFDPGKAEISRELDSDIGELERLIRSNSKISKIEILASHSPENDDTKTGQMAAKRSRVLQQLIRKNIDEHSYTNTNKAITFYTRNLTNNWEMFLKKVQSSALPENEIQEILDVINGSGSYKDKAEKLTKLNSYEYIESYIYPMLRFADVRITHERDKKQDYEIYLLSRKIVNQEADADVLTDEELTYAATLTPLLSEKRKIYEAAIKSTGSWQAYNNLGVVYLEMARKELKPRTKQAMLAKAIQNLTYGSHRKPDASTFYNLAVAHHMQGNVTEALQSYDYAIRLGGKPELLQRVFADKTALLLENNRYDEAIGSLSYAGASYQTYMNKGLAYLLKENYDQAAVFYNQALELKPNDGQAYYMLAIIGARTKDENLMAQNLKLAIKSDRAYVAKAIDDLEFREYHRKPVFEVALK